MKKITNTGYLQSSDSADRGNKTNENG